MRACDFVDLGSRAASFHAIGINTIADCFSKGENTVLSCWCLITEFHIDGIINKTEYAALAEVYTTACDAVIVLNAEAICR